MKRVILLFISLSTIYLCNASIFSDYLSFATGIEDGWYKATVKYYDYNTGSKATYTLNVKVESDRVTIISFGNDGYLHSGSNDNNYIYKGGYLEYGYNDAGSIIVATTQVIIEKPKSSTVKKSEVSTSEGTIPIYASSLLFYKASKIATFDIKIE